MMVNVKDYGADGKGKRLETAFFQSAVDACFENGGGTVIVPPGKYLVGKIILKSNITLCLESGSELIASPDINNDYPSTDHYEGSVYSALKKAGAYDESLDPRKEGVAVIYAGSSENIRITGMGKINGNYKNILIKNTEKQREHKWYNYVKDFDIYSPDRSGKIFRRPVGIFMEDCHNVKIDSITIFDSSMYSTNLRGCTDVEFSGIKVHNYIGADNADGFHFSSCTDVNISDCVLKCGDDCIAIDPNECGTPSRRYQINNCTFDSRNNCFRIFTNLNPEKIRRGLIKGGKVSDIVINNCTVERASSFAFIHADEGEIERIAINNISGNISLLGTVFLIVSHSGYVRNVTLSNGVFEANGVGYIYSNVKNGISDVKISDMIVNVKPETKVFGHGFHMMTACECLKSGDDTWPHYFLSHYAPYFLQITNAKNVSLNDFTINWLNGNIDDIYEVNEYYPNYQGKFHDLWGKGPHWPAVFVENSENITGNNLSCEPFGDAERITVKNSTNISL